MPLSTGLVNLKPLEGILIMHFGCFLIKMLVKFFLWSILIHFNFDFTLYVELANCQAPFRYDIL